MDREKVVEGLRHCTSHDDGRDKFGGVGKCGGCPYYGHDCTDRMKKDALAMLKEQKAVEPKKTAYQRVDHIIAYRYRCGMCDISIFPSYKYCPFCGQAVKWE